jgi:hypothetical protein
VPLIVCSADVTLLRARSADFARLGNLYTLEKPFAIEDVAAAVNQGLDGKAPPDRRLPPPPL